MWSNHPKSLKQGLSSGKVILIICESAWLTNNNYRGFLFLFFFIIILFSIFMVSYLFSFEIIRFVGM